MHIKKAQELDLSSEDVLLLSCARSKLDNQARGEIDFILDNDLDWEHILEMAARHRLLPLLYINLNAISPSKVPVDVLRDLKTNFHNNARRNLLLTGELIKVMQLLDDNGVKAVTYKGPVLAYSAYGNVGYRQFGDIDILTDKKGGLKSKNLMFSNGYELIVPIKLSDTDYMKLEAEYIFINKKLGTKIEINWNFEGNFFSFKEDSNLLFDKQVKYNINDFEFLSFSPDNQILMLSIHAAKHDWLRLSWILDIVEFVNRHPINWEETLKKADKLGVKKILLINLSLAWDLWSLELPNIVTEEFNSKSLRNTVRKVKAKIFNDNENSWTLLEKFFLDIEKREDVYSGIKDCVYGLTRATYADFEDIPIRTFLFFIYPLLRPFLLIKRYGKGPI